MKIKFYLALITLTLFTQMYCIASAAVDHDVKISAQTTEAAAISYLTTHDDARCVSYTTNPGDTESYKTPTREISSFLSEKTKKTIITVAIGEKITHFKSDVNYLLKDELQRNNLLSLEPTDPYYGHFRALSLIDDIATQLVGYVFGDDFDVDAAISKVDNALFTQIWNLSEITRDMFKGCFTNAHSNHKTGIEKHIEKLKGANAESPVIVPDVTASNPSTLEFSESDNGLRPDQDLLSIGKLTNSEDSKADDEEHKGSTAAEETVIQRTLSDTTLVPTVSDDGSLELDISSKVHESPGKKDPLDVLSSGNGDSNGATGAATTVTVEIIETIIFLNAADAKAAAKSKLEAAKKAKPYDQAAVNELEKEVGLARTYKTAQEAYDKDTKCKNPTLGASLSAAKEAYENYMRAKGVAESSDAGRSRRNSGASDTGTSRKDSDGRTLGPKRFSFTGMMSGKK
ncbi:MAG: hypothetical protein NWS47_02875 [Alphaproteobacteria bacterium]|nr:hypothetical protein [Alphaproteobacteria bacterium]